MVEEWLDVENYEGIYKVSNFGNVYDCRKSSVVGTNYVSGYKYVTLRKSGSVKGVGVHRLVAKAFIPNPEKLRLVNHKDIDKLNNYADNLEWQTHKGNSEHYQEEKRKGNKSAGGPCLGHIKVYARDEEELELWQKFAKSKGMSASTFIRSLALREIQKEGE